MEFTKSTTHKQSQLLPSGRQFQFNHNTDKDASSFFVEKTI